MNEMNFDINEKNVAHLPILPLRGLVIFPHMSASFDVGREGSVNAIQSAMHHNKRVILVAQKDLQVERPSKEDLYTMGIIAEIRQVVRLSPEALCAFVEGKERVDILNIYKKNNTLYGDALKIEETPAPVRTAAQTASVRLIKNLFAEYIALNTQVGNDALVTMEKYEDAGRLTDFIAGSSAIDYTLKQNLLEELNPEKRMQSMIETLMQENDLLEIEEEMQQRVKDNMDQNQHEYYLREQLKVLQNELGEGDDDVEEVARYRETIEKLPIDAKSREKLLKEVNRLAKMPPMSHEGAVIRSYLDIVLDMPFGKSTKDNYDIAQAERILNEGHYGLEKVKERILEALAVRRMGNLKGQILCLAGPPGVGKTSVARSIASAMGRNFARVSLGGIHDEAEIRGHRKTYIGAMPGRIIAAVETAGSCNPVILLDEIDKLSGDFRGDPASALLEALDPEQNRTYTDHFLEIPFDLSDVFFITTANSLSTIPAPLLDRMDVIELPSYLDFEKTAIAKNHLIPKQRLKHGLSVQQFKISDAALAQIISGYTREAGVRNLERLLAKLMRKADRKIVEGTQKTVSIGVNNLKEYLGPPVFKDEALYDGTVCGIANGLAWTSVGGEMLNVEVVALEGNGKLELTGSLGDIMKESAKIAISFIRSVAKKYGLDADFYKTKDIHIHFPEGAVPKDGPSAGITIATAIFSALSGIPVSNKVAMTGEITLNGRVLPIGGLKEKATAALKHNIKTIIIPQDNMSDISEMDDCVVKQLRFIPVTRVEQVLKHALLYMPIEEKKTGETHFEEVPTGGKSIKSVRIGQ